MKSVPILRQFRRKQDWFVVRPANSGSGADRYGVVDHTVSAQHGARTTRPIVVAYPCLGITCRRRSRLKQHSDQVASGDRGSDQAAWRVRERLLQRCKSELFFPNGGDCSFPMIGLRNGRWPLSRRKCSCRIARPHRCASLTVGTDGIAHVPAVCHCCRGPCKSANCGRRYQPPWRPRWQRVGLRFSGPSAPVPFPGHSGSRPEGLAGP